MKKQIMLLICVSIATIALIIIKNQYSEYILEDATYGIRRAINLREIDNLFIGSSVIRQGVSIEVLDNELPAKNYILTYNGNQPALEYLQLKKLIDNGVSIKRVYIDMYAYSANQEPDLADEKLLMELSIPEKRSLYHMLGSQNVSYWWQYYISANNELICTYPIEKSVINAMFRDGGTLVEAVGISEDEYDAISPFGVNVSKENTYINNVQKRGIIDIVSLCEEHSIEPIFIETPKAANIANDKGYKHIMEEYEEILRDLSVEYIRADITDMEAYDYVDGIHLSSLGRKKYTNWIIKLLI